MKFLQLTYEFYYWLPPWDREPEYPEQILQHIVENGVTTLEELIEEYMNN